MNQTTTISELIGYLNIVKRQHGNLPITINFESIFDGAGSVIYGDDSVYVTVMERDKNEDPNPDEQEKVISIQNYEKES